MRNKKTKTKTNKTKKTRNILKTKKRQRITCMAPGKPENEADVGTEIETDMKTDNRKRNKRQKRITAISLSTSLFLLDNSWFDAIVKAACYAW